MKRTSDRGYAMLAAIVGIAAFSYVGFEVVAENRGVISEVQAENEQAKLTAACDAGLALAVDGLAAHDRRDQWLIDGTKRTMMFDAVALTITVEDERGKIPLNGVNEDQIRTLFADAGASGAKLDTLVDSFEDWLDPDTNARPNGAEADYYARFGYAPRNAGFRSVGELRLIKGMDDSLFQRVAPVTTAFFGESGGFSESTSQILALEALEELKPDAPEIQERQQELSGLKPAQDVQNPPSLLGRTLTVRVEAKRAGASVTRSSIVELTGAASDPVWYRNLD
jgi:general secretion pathway protein K